MSGGNVRTLTDDEQALVDDFNAQFQTSKSLEQIRAVLGSKHVHEWYVGWRAARSLAKSVPVHWEIVGMTPQEWQGTQAGLQRIRAARAAHQAAVTRAATAYRAAVAQADGALTTATAGTTNLELVVLGGYEDLTLPEQFLVTEAGGISTAAGKAVLEAARQRWLDEARQGRRPYP